MEINFTKATKAQQEIISDLDKLESSHVDDGKTLVQLQGQVAASLASLSSTMRALETSLNREINPPKRQLAKERIQKLNQDTEALKERFNTLKRRGDERVLNHERNELLELRQRTSLQKDHDTTINIDHAVSQREMMENSSTRVDEYLATGNIMLQSLRDQRNTLKGTRKRLLDAANSLGLSQHVIRLVERRSREDTLILIAGIVVTLIIMYLVWRYLA